MTTDQAARYLQTSEQALRKRAQRAGVPAHRDDTGRWLFNRDEIDHARGRCRPEAREQVEDRLAGLNGGLAPLPADFDAAEVAACGREHRGSSNRSADVRDG